MPAPSSGAGTSVQWESTRGVRELVGWLGSAVDVLQPATMTVRAMRRPLAVLRIRPTIRKMVIGVKAWNQ